MKGKATPTTINIDTDGRAGTWNKKYVDSMISKSQLTCLIHVPGHE